MNTGAFASFLRHLLFLLILLKLTNGLILIYSTYRCFVIFDEVDLLPLNMKAPRHSVYIALLEMQMTVFGTAFGIIILSVVGFFGAVYLHTYPLINFTVGLNGFILVTGELGCAVFLKKMLWSFNEVVVRPVKQVFQNSNRVEDESMGDQIMTWSMNLGKDGWVRLIMGTREEHGVVDFIQTSMECCGLTGRTFWKVRPPASCCDQAKYPQEQCMIGTAHTSSCLYTYHSFYSCVSGMMMECIVFGLISLGTSICSLYLARLHVLYPTQNYGSESSSDTDDYDETS